MWRNYFGAAADLIPVTDIFTVSDEVISTYHVKVIDVINMTDYKAIVILLNLTIQLQKIRDLSITVETILPNQIILEAVS